jgi:hypothetical protein
MQLAKQVEINEDQSPLPDKVIGELHNSNPAEAALIASTLPEAQRAQLAAFCYKRKHLSHLAIMIAASCQRQQLISAMGPAGEALFNQSRDPEKAIRELREAAGETARKAISLATFGNKAKNTSDDSSDKSQNTVVSLRR